MKQILAAASDWRMLLILGAGIVAAAVTSNPFPALIGLGIYCWAVPKLAGTPRFQQAAEQVKLANQLADRYKELQLRARELPEAVVAALPGQERPWKQRVMDVQNAARSIYHEWLAHPQEQADKAPVVEEALKLAAVYHRMLRAYHAIYSGRGKGIDLNAVRERHGRNQRRLEQTLDLEARKALLQAIEMDERVLRQEADEDVEKERYMAKLSAIESTMDVYRKQVFDPAPGDGGQRLHEMLVEAEAMDQALDEVQQRTRVRAH